MPLIPCGQAVPDDDDDDIDDDDDDEPAVAERTRLQITATYIMTLKSRGRIFAHVCKQN
jgi:hypothetical protein